MPTINDIAREAGVSHGTVSNVLNKTGKVSIEKIRLVEDAIQRLGYVPNTQAKRLRQGAPNTVAVILPSLREEKYQDLFTAIQLNLSAGQRDLFVYQTEDVPAEEETILENLRVSGLAMLVVVSCLERSCLEKYRSLPCQIVYVERRPARLRPNEWFVSFDPQVTGREMLSRCREKGWRRVAYFGTVQLGDGTDSLLEQMQRAAKREELELTAVSAGYKLALNQAFELARNCGGYDGVITQSSVCTAALRSAFQALRLERSPELLTIGSASASMPGSSALYQLDYGQLGLQIVKLMRSLGEEGAAQPQELLLQPKGFPSQFRGVEPMPGEEITMLTLDNPSTQALKNLLPEFEAHSGIRVKLVEVPYEDLHSQLDLIGPNFSYDLIRIDVAKFDSLGKQTFLPFREIPLQPEELPLRLIKGGYDSYSLLDGQMYALPLDPSVQIFLYRTDLFEDATLCRAYYERFHENLTVPTSYEQYLRVAEFFTRQYNPDSPTEFGATQTCGSAATIASDFLPYYLAHAGDLCTPEGEIRLDTPEMAEAIRQYRQMERFSCKQKWWGDNIRQFAQGQVATTVVYSNYAAALIGAARSNVVGRVGAAVLPGGKPLLGGGIVGVSRYSRKAQVCKQFFRWYYSTEVASMLVRLGGTSPIVDAYEDFQNYSTFPWMNTAKKSFGLGRRGPRTRVPQGFSIQRYEFAVGSAVHNAMEGLMDPETASRMAQAMYDTTDRVSK